MTVKKLARAVLGVGILSCVVGSVQAEVVIETVPVGNPGNAGELSGSGAGAPGGYGPDRICGAVDYVYNIGKYEVTVGQYTEFLNAVAATDPFGLYDSRMLSRLLRLQDRAQRLVGQLQLQRGVEPIAL